MSEADCGLGGVCHWGAQIWNAGALTSQDAEGPLMKPGLILFKTKWDSRYICQGLSLLKLLPGLPWRAPQRLAKAMLWRMSVDTLELLMQMNS